MRKMGLAIALMIPFLGGITLTEAASVQVLDAMYLGAEIDWFPKKEPEPFSERFLQFLKDHVPSLKVGGHAIPGAMSLIAIPVIMIGIGFIYYLQRKRP